MEKKFYLQKEESTWMREKRQANDVIPELMLHVYMYLDYN